jgi:hypothetical protein
MEPILPISLDCSFVITPSVFSNVYLNYANIINKLIKQTPDSSSRAIVATNNVICFKTKETLITVQCMLNDF